MGEKSIYQRYLDFKERHKLSREKIIEIVEAYANSDYEFARSYYTQKYGISEHVFYTARDFAVIFYLVGPTTCKRLEAKSKANSISHGTTYAHDIYNHFRELEKLQIQFLDSFSKDDILDIGTLYSDGNSIDEIASIYDTGNRAISELLRRGIINFIINGEILNKIHERVGDGLIPILNSRSENKKKLTTCVLQEISFLDALKSSYAFNPFIPEGLTLDKIEEHLNASRANYSKILSL